MIAYIRKLNIHLMMALLVSLFLTIIGCNQVKSNKQAAAKATLPHSTVDTKVIPPLLTLTTIATFLPIAPTVTPTSTSTSTPVIKATPPEMALCRTPTEDYSRIDINGETINQRTELMLNQAKEIYNGPGDLKRVTQGSYTIQDGASFGTHAGGGVVDISIRDPINPDELLFGEVEAMISALRYAGFAAWYRDENLLYPGSPPHIHAVAIGDEELSPAAEAQLTGIYGYFRGWDGLTPEFGGPNPDPHGTPVICPWMNELGYSDLRNVENVQH